LFCTLRLVERVGGQGGLQRELSRIWQDIYETYQKESGIDLGMAMFKRIATKYCVASSEGKVSNYFKINIIIILLVLRAFDVTISSLAFVLQIKLMSKSSIDEIVHVISHITYIVERGSS